MTCPQCAYDGMVEKEGLFPECPDCGFVAYPADALAEQREVRREFEQAQRDCWPEPVPADYHTQEAETERMREAWRLKRA